MCYNISNSHLFFNQVIQELGLNAQVVDRPFYDYPKGCLRDKAKMVILEATRAITKLSGVTSRELTPSIAILKLFLSSSKLVLQFAIVRTLITVGVYCSKTIQYGYILRLRFSLD